MIEAKKHGWREITESITEPTVREVQLFWQAWDMGAQAERNRVVAVIERLPRKGPWVTREEAINTIIETGTTPQEKT